MPNPHQDDSWGYFKRLTPLQQECCFWARVRARRDPRLVAAMVAFARERGVPLRLAEATDAQCRDWIDFLKIPIQEDPPMYPDAIHATMLQAATEGRHEDAIHAAEDLIGWLHSGGFPPGGLTRLQAILEARRCRDQASLTLRAKRLLGLSNEQLP